MRPRARTPDELDALLEDAFVLRDRRAVAALFENDALLVDVAAGQARGIAVARRHDHSAWRYAIALLSVDHTTAKEEQ